MPNKKQSTHQKINWTPEDRARHKAIRDKFQKEKPTMKQLLAGGDYVGPIPQGTVLNLLQILGELREAREKAGVSLTDLAQKTGIDKSALSRLENGHFPNPTLETISRYARGLGKQVALVIEDLEANTR